MVRVIQAKRDASFSIVVNDSTVNLRKKTLHKVYYMLFFAHLRYQLFQSATLLIIGRVGKT